MRPKVVIIDYRLGNMFSVMHAFKHLGVEAEITTDSKKVIEADGIVLPGVGAFGDAMNNLKKDGLDAAILESVIAGKPFMGVCLGMQLLFETSEEFGDHKGLGIIPGTIKKFSNKGADGKKVRVPQIAWNRIKKKGSGKSNWENSPLKGIKENEFMYFVHSFFAAPSSDDFVLTKTEYEGTEYCSSVLKDNVFATQFHPEKSAEEGLKIYRNWLTLLK